MTAVHDAIVKRLKDALAVERAYSREVTTLWADEGVRIRKLEEALQEIADLLIYREDSVYTDAAIIRVLEITSAALEGKGTPDAPKPKAGFCPTCGWGWVEPEGKA